MDKTLFMNWNHTVFDIQSSKPVTSFRRSAYVEQREERQAENKAKRLFEARGRFPN